MNSESKKILDRFSDRSQYYMDSISLEYGLKNGYIQIAAGLRILYRVAKNIKRKAKEARKSGCLILNILFCPEAVLQG